MNKELFLLIILLFAVGYSIYVIIYEKRSVRSKLIEEAIKLSGYKKYNSKEKNVQKEIEKRLRDGEQPYKLPIIPLKVTVDKHNFNGMDYYVFNKKDKGKKIYYLHGGAYFDNPLFFHIDFCDWLAKKLDCEIVLPIYPKLPFNDYKYSQTKVLDLYKKLFNKKTEVILMGDSSGGGLCLSLYYLLNKKQIVLPIKTILLSPWLDVSVNNPDISSLEDKDPQLTVVGLKKMGKLWANNSKLTNPLVSPLFGNVAVLNNIYLFVGTHEIFLPDCRLFYKKCIDKKINIKYFEYKNMDHVFFFQPIPEAKKAKKTILEIINNKKKSI